MLKRWTFIDETLVIRIHYIDKHTKNVNRKQNRNLFLDQHSVNVNRECLLCYTVRVCMNV